MILCFQELDCSCWCGQQRQMPLEFQWRITEVHQSPAPTHPLSRVSLTMETFRPRVGGGFQLREGERQREKIQTTLYFLDQIYTIKLFKSELYTLSFSGWSYDLQLWTQQQSNMTAIHTTSMPVSKNTKMDTTCAPQTSTGTSTWGSVSFLKKTAYEVAEKKSDTLKISHKITY